MSKKYNIEIIATGGTIGSLVEKIKDKNHVILQDGPKSKHQLKALSGPLTKSFIKDNNIQIRTSYPLNLLSEDFCPSDWCRLAESVDSVIQADIDAVVILHGTDTMAYSAAALSFMLANTKVPIVFTGSSEPPNHPSSDADKNVADSLLAALKLPAGVYVCFANNLQTSYVHHGTAVRKFYQDGIPFHSVNRNPFAEITNGIFLPRGIQKAHSNQPLARIGASSKVFSLNVYPGVNFKSILEYLKASETKAVVLTLYPALTAPSSPRPSSLKQFMKDCQREKVSVVLALPSLKEGVTNFYDSTLDIEASEAILLPTLPETAFVKTSWALGIGNDFNSLPGILREEVCGEFEEMLYR